MCIRDSVHRVLKNLGAPPGDLIQSNTFSLPEHNKLSNDEIANDLGAYFSQISQEYQPLDQKLLPDRVNSKLNSPNAQIPSIEPHTIYEKIKEMTIPDSTVPGDFPPRIWKEFSLYLADPVSVIANQILSTGQWPDSWKTEYVTVIEKETDPKSKEDLRNISLTQFISKLVENLIYDLLIEQWGEKLDSGQFGGRHGYSVLLYLVKLVDFVMSNLDKKNTAVILGLCDFSKAYNRQCHNRLLTCFSDLGTPNYLLKVLASYLTQRSMVVRHKGTSSKTYSLPGSSAQGTNLGILSYLVNINSCGVPLEDIMDHLETHQSDTDQSDTIFHPILPLPEYHINEREGRFKYIDDLSLCQSINLSDLEKIDWEMEQPLSFRDRTLHHLPSDKNPLQRNFDNVHKFCKIQQNVVNTRKTKTVVFNTARTRDFTPRVVNASGDLYENTEAFKLLGVDFATHHSKVIDLNPYLNKCIQTAYGKLWMLRRLGELGIPIHLLLLTYKLRVRVFLEQNVPLWTFNLSKVMAGKMEKVQKIAAYIILGKHAHKDYFCNLSMLELDTLENRRHELAIKFAAKTLKHPEHRKIFTVTESLRNGRRVAVPASRTTRYERSTIPSLARLINENQKLSSKI